MRLFHGKGGRMNEPMMNRIRGHSRDRLCRAVVSVTIITVRRAPKSSAGPLSAQNRILRIFNTTFGRRGPPLENAISRKRVTLPRSHSRRIFRNCTFVPSNSSDLFELFVRGFSLGSVHSEIGRYRSLKKKASFSNK